MSERRYYTLEEATQLLPWLIQCFTRIVQLRAQMRALYEFLVEKGHRPDPENLRSEAGTDEVRSARAKFVGLMEAMQEDLSEILATGVEVKDLDTGLCDFWSYIDGREVYLCWRFGETSIGFYHAPEAGFAGRKPLPKGVLTSNKPRTWH